ncbi:MAG: hypothetical protein CMJ62_11935 [Planctomycetaceae bacterium]|nr:hypothetical protein [Planctomycetaceae bacterium]
MMTRWATIKKKGKFPGIRFAFLLILLLMPAPDGSATEGAGDGLLSIHLVPRDVKLWGVGASQRFLVLGKYPGGLERDLSGESQFLISDPGQGKIVSPGKFVAARTGPVILTAQFEGQQAKTRIEVADRAHNQPFSFSRVIGGILTKKGCNTNDCHGAIKGREGFKLSDNVLDPKEDYRGIVEGGTYQVLSAEAKEPKIPRIDLENPEESLLLLKPTMSVDHEGSKHFEVGSPDYQVILDWIRAGAPYGEEIDPEGVSVQGIEVFPLESVMGPGGMQQLLVTAHLSNGHREDITEQVHYVSNDPKVVEVNESGVVRGAGSGETGILIRAPGHTVSASFGVVEESVVDYPKLHSKNFIDDFIHAKLRKFNIIPSELSGDEEFLRRVCLDLTGTLPPPDRVREFVRSRNPDKRDELIEILLDSPQYVDYWGFWFGDLLRVTFTVTGSAHPTKAYEDWVVNSIAANKPYDEIARQRIAAQGYAAPKWFNYIVLGSLATPEKIMAENVQVFFGRRLDCAECHEHPYDQWSQNQFWGLTAFYAGLKSLKDTVVVTDMLGDGLDDRVRQTGMIHPRTKQQVVPTFLDGAVFPEEKWLAPLTGLATWMTSHSYFSEAAVNRIWSNFFGRGIVDPVDDFRVTNPPTHPGLLAALARDFESHGYDLKHLMRTIVQSRTYQRSGISNDTNKEDRINYSRSLPRPLQAAVLLDAISSATDVEEDFVYHEWVGGGNPPAGIRAMQMIPDLCPSQFMDVYGRSMRKRPESGNPAPTLGQALHMWAGPTYTSKISKQGGRLQRLLERGDSAQEIIEEFYLATLTRSPTPDERGELLEFLRQRDSHQQEALEALVWALISSREFSFNH